MRTLTVLLLILVAAAISTIFVLPRFLPSAAPAPANCDGGPPPFAAAHG
jgi:hypothetical protein